MGDPFLERGSGERKARKMGARRSLTSVICRNSTFRDILWLHGKFIDRSVMAVSRCGTLSEVIHVAIPGTEVLSKFRTRDQLHSGQAGHVTCRASYDWTLARDQRRCLGFRIAFHRWTRRRLD